MNSVSIIPVIMTGGSGTRLWALSRKSFPKQYLNLFVEHKKSMLQQTQERISNLRGIKSPILICNEDHRFIVAEQMRDINIKPHSIVLEPFGRGTAAAITIAALKSLEKEDDPLLLVLSSDHYVENSQKFVNVIQDSIDSVLDENIITFGIKPNYPATGYGYIKSNKENNGKNNQGFCIDQFLEKPDFETATSIYKDPSYFWNSGIFFFKSKVVLNEIRKFNPEIFSSCKEAIEKSVIDLDFQRIEEESFKKCPNVSFDIAVMERTNLGIIFSLEVGWKDIGSWDSVWEITQKDNDGNATLGKVISSNNKNCYLRSEDRILVAQGLEDIIVVETSDAVLVSNKSYSQEIKTIVDKLKKNNISEGIEHQRIYRPWGFYETLIEDKFWKVKLIKVNSKEKLSLQMHKFRSEHWVVVSGIANVQINQNLFTLNKNQNVSIPNGSMHRLENNTNNDLYIIEVQNGSYLGEDDIVRFDDKYGRFKKE